MEEEKLTWAGIMQGFAESKKRNDELFASILEMKATFAAEAEKRQAEAAERQAEYEKRQAERQAEYEKRQAEYEKRQAEYEKRQAERQAEYEKRQAERRAEHEKWQVEADKRSAKLDALIAEMSKNIIGISDSNGMFAEELFLNTLSEKKEFAGIHFDEVEGDVGCMHKQPDGQRLKDQFDIVMTNSAAAAIVEAKYRARKEDITTLAVRKVKNFKTLFPEYRGLKIYLGLAALAFEDGVIEEARKYGVGLLQQVGETVEYATDWEVKAY
ncbi:hypothetical protein R80B4_00289 [Fibrobacteres bacterium R8-0-B4]